MTPRPSANWNPSWPPWRPAKLTRRVQRVVPPTRRVGARLRLREHGLHDFALHERTTKRRITDVLEQRTGVARGPFAHFFGLRRARGAQRFAAEGPRGQAVLGTL